MRTEDVKDSGDVLLQVRGLKKWFPLKKDFLTKTAINVRAVDGVSLDIKEGETFGLVGESGCGKTTLGRTILRLIEPDSGSVLFEGKEIFKLKRSAMLKIRKDMQFVFQDPYASLNPRMSVESIVGEPLKIYKVFEGKQLKARVLELLEVVGLDSGHAKRYPHEFSGGQRQRIGIARALALNPKFLICDEPVSALDVSIRSQILNLLEDLQTQFNLTYLFISHDLSVVEHICDTVAVMYLGKVVEVAPKSELYENPLHPYTKALLSAIPIADPKAKKEKIIIEGDVPSPIDPPKGCYFRTRCKQAYDLCTTEPDLANIYNDHLVACHLVKS